MPDPVKPTPAAPIASPDRAAAIKKLDEDEKARADALAKQSKVKPTPTQRENDLARLGYPVDEKEDDGSGPEIKK